MYQQDSFFTLSFWGQCGLVILSGLLFITMLAITRRLPCWRLPLALIGFWLFVWLSPQVYYQYYRILFDGLPAQWVIWPIRSPLEAMKLLFFSGPANLSAHGQGLLGWAMIVVAVLAKRPLRRNAAN